MKIPKFDPETLNTFDKMKGNLIMPFELAQLHCLRSIATSLECIAAIHVEEVKGLTTAAKTEILSRLDMYSVREG